MKDIKNYILESSKIYEGINSEEQLCKKLYDLFGDHGMFENIEDDNTFYISMLPDEEDNELKQYEKNGLTKDILDLAERKKSYQGGGEVIYTFDIYDIVEYFDDDCDRAFEEIKSWFSYLL